MRTAKRLLVMVAVIVVAFSVSPSAQWPRRQQPGVPKRPDGTVNVTAPTPRAPDGKPDLSGIWDVSPRREKPRGAAGRPPLAVFANIGVAMVGGFRTSRGRRSSRRSASPTSDIDNPDALCLPQGPLQYHLDPQPRQIYQMPGRTLIVYESNYGLRTIHTDGRPLPKLGEPQPYWLGTPSGVGRRHLRGGVEPSAACRGLAADAWHGSAGQPVPTRCA